MEGWPRRHRITVDEYYRMAEVGLLAPDARVELIEGEIIDMAPIGPRHGSVVNDLTRLLVNAVSDRGIVQVQGVVRLDDASEPQPDVALLVGRSDNYRSQHPSPADTPLLIEVSDSTLAYDLNTKVPLYAAHGIPEVWIVDLQHDELRCYRTPQAGRYLVERVAKTPGITPIAMLPGLEIDLSGIL